MMSASNRSFRWPNGVGLLLVGHGSRDEAGNREFLETARLVAQNVAPAPVEPCFLEFAEPAIAEGFERLAQRRLRSIAVVPVLLFAAGHAKRDIPAAVAEAAARHPAIAVVQAEHLGCHEAILELSERRYREAISAHPANDHDTALVMVGRGSHDAEATAEMRRFAASRAASARVRRASACFVAMAEPGLPPALAEAAGCGAARVVVQPHLLFCGVLVERIRRTVDEYRTRCPAIAWITAAHLGPADLLVHAILCRAAESLSLQRARGTC
jgi:sirohydrochlorin cobaltochelatase